MSQPESDAPSPTDARQPVDQELRRWRRIYFGERYYYGVEPGPMARRAVRYHRSFLPHGGTALDVGCGEGQDLVFLAERGYTVTGIEFTPEGAEKSRRFLAERNLEAQVFQQDLREFLAYSPDAEAPQSLNTRTPEHLNTFDLVLAVNTLQFLGPDALPCLERLMERVAPGGVIGVSMFGREAGEPELIGTVFFTPWEELLERFRGWRKLEGGKLWQWSAATDEPQAFVQLIARKPAGASLLSFE